MNTSFCSVSRYFIRYRESSLLSWTTRSILSDISCTGQLSVTNYMLFGLLDDTEYEYRLRANYCDDSLSAWSPIVNFTTGIGGCIDPLALNYDSLASDDNGSCIYPVGGCLDSLASNYDSIVDYDDGSCEYLCYYPYPSGINVDSITDSRATINWNNMNSSFCSVDKYFIRYRIFGDTIWETRSISDSSINCQFGLNINNKILFNLTNSTLYEYKLMTVYCDGTISDYSNIFYFSTKNLCPSIINLNINTISNSQAQVSWDTLGTYVYARVKYRINGPGQSWSFVGGINNKFLYPLSNIIIDSLQQGKRYRVVVRTYCDSVITSFNSTWSSPKSWRQLHAKLDYGFDVHQISVYPNPSSDNVNISLFCEELIDFSLTIVNSLGRIVINENHKNYIGNFTKKINFKVFTAGIYFLKIQKNNEFLVKKIIIK